MKNCFYFLFEPLFTCLGRNSSNFWGGSLENFRDQKFILKLTDLQPKIRILNWLYSGMFVIIFSAVTRLRNAYCNHPNQEYDQFNHSGHPKKILFWDFKIKSWENSNHRNLVANSNTYYIKSFHLRGQKNQRWITSALWELCYCECC